MTKLSARRGSALLIVLGMVGVMVISAVAFSAYMRYSRLPSSFLRRTSASRHLAHAAMAEAIDIIDASIGDNPHPGFGEDLTVYPRRGGTSARRNYWLGRCYVGVETNNLDNLPSPSATVPVLTLEALAYIPPDIVNQVRYYSRRSAAAKWHNFDYDAGRFAFCAIDVSDHFDVNRVFANCGRDSSDNGKFSLAFALETEDHGSYRYPPSSWDTTVSAKMGTMPFTSLADLGLALKDSYPLFFPAISAIYQKDGARLDNISRNDVKYFNVVADGLYPSVAKDANRPGDISRRQPFRSMPNGNASASDVYDRKNDSLDNMLADGKLSRLDMISLYDYLDYDDLPVSLALPTMERVPMVCGFQSKLKIKFSTEVSKTTDPEGFNIATAQIGDEYKEIRHYKLKVDANERIFSALCMFPFRSESLRPEPSGYSVEMAFRVCLGNSSDPNPSLRVPEESRYFIRDSAAFDRSGVDDGMISMKSRSQELSFPAGRNSDVQNALDLKEPQIDDISTVGNWFNNNDIFTVEVKFRVEADGSGSKTSTEIERNVTKINFHPVKHDGVDFDQSFSEANLKQGDFSFKARPYLTAVARIVKGGKTYDLAPASYIHDAAFNGVNADPNRSFRTMYPDGQPILVFRGSGEIGLGPADIETATAPEVEVEFKPVSSLGDNGKTILCSDPRWNFASEDFVCDGSSIEDAQNWYVNDPGKCGVGVGGRDRDIFMFVSNQGYMQSVSELAFLPRTVEALLSADDGDFDERYGDAKFNGTSFSEFPTSIDNAPHGKFMWRTYRLYPQGGLSSDGLYNLGLFDGGSGFRMNPYTTSREALLAALANPPCSWWVASTNYTAQGQERSSLEDMDVKNFNMKHAFSAMNSGAKFAWEDMEKIAGRIGEAMRSNSNGDWCSGYDSLDWAGDDDHFAGVQLSSETCDLYDIDRKFLYGFWRDCFAAKQQLFLVFVRAEPLMMGSGAAGKAPPPLGARAMALVWRKPAAGSETGVAGGKKAWPDSLSFTRDAARDSSGGGGGNLNLPHETRILFYRQFD